MNSKSSKTTGCEWIGIGLSLSEKIGEKAKLVLATLPTMYFSGGANDEMLLGMSYL